MRRLTALLAIGAAFGQDACSSSSKTRLATGGAAGTAGNDAASGAGGGSGAGAGASGRAGSGTDGSNEAGADYANTVLGDAPSLYWRELAGTGSVVDVSPKHNDGNYVGCVEPSDFRSGPSIHLCGGYLHAGDIFDFVAKTPFSFEAWIKPESVQLSTFARIAGKENPVPGPRQGWDVILIGWGQDAEIPALVFERWALVDGSSIGSGVHLTNPKVVSESFTHLVVTYDGTTCRIYLNGVSALESASTDSMGDTAGTFRVGADPFGGSNWRGDIDEIAVYDNALLSERIVAHYEAGKAERR